MLDAILVQQASTELIEALEHAFHQFDCSVSSCVALVVKFLHVGRHVPYPVKAACTSCHSLRASAAEVDTGTLSAAVADTGLGGGALVRQISVLAHHGDPFLRACLGRMLTAVSAPLVEMVRAWLFDGRLDMPPGEFFICQSSTAPGTMQAPP